MMMMFAWLDDHFCCLCIIDFSTWFVVVVVGYKVLYIEIDDIQSLLTSGSC
jgi:hypothetical protein